MIKLLLATILICTALISGPVSANNKGSVSAAELLDMARSEYNKNKKQPVDECVMEGNWMYRVLHLISQAVEADQAKTLAKLDSKSFDFSFRKSMIYKKWRLAVTPLWSKSAIKNLMHERDWWPTVNSFPPVTLAFLGTGKLVQNELEGEKELGSWSAEDGAVKVGFAKNNTGHLIPTATKYYFNMGQAWYYVLDLKPRPTDFITPWQVPLIAGPRVGDCGDYNF